MPYFVIATATVATSYVVLALALTLALFSRPSFKRLIDALYPPEYFIDDFPNLYKPKLTYNRKGNQ
uniref:AA_permease domain-containing protein n=1 Tax=Mesocestoides corti TaxID=53468 RepID=A0A5K3EJ74_MESCO